MDATAAHHADDAAFGPTVVRRRGVADRRLHGKGAVRRTFAVGVQAPGPRSALVDVPTPVDVPAGVGGCCTV